jgi:hypothetical protein
MAQGQAADVQDYPLDKIGSGAVSLTLPGQEFTLEENSPLPALAGFGLAAEMVQFPRLN